MKFRDYYEVMGVPRDAGADDIKRAYRKLARQFHPDVSKEADAEERFKELGEAYAVLSDPEKRVAYDQLGTNRKAGESFRPPPDWGAGFEFHADRGDAEDGGFSDFFESLFARGARAGNSGNRSGQSFHAHGQDTYAKVLIDLDDSYRGATHTITLKQTHLDSAGRPVLKERTLSVRIPKGVRQGQYIRLAGQGAPGLGDGRTGDLYLEISFRESLNFHVDGTDVTMNLPIAPWEAALGATVKLPTPSGLVELKVPAGSNTGTRLRLKGRGIPSAQAGDLFVVLRIAMPPATSAAAKAAWNQVKESSSGFSPRVEMGA